MRSDTEALLALWVSSASLVVGIRQPAQPVMAFMLVWLPLALGSVPYSTVGSVAHNNHDSYTSPLCKHFLSAPVIEEFISLCLFHSDSSEVLTVSCEGNRRNECDEHPE